MNEQHVSGTQRYSVYSGQEITFITGEVLVFRNSDIRSLLATAKVGKVGTLKYIQYT